MISRAKYIEWADRVYAAELGTARGMSGKKPKPLPTWSEHRGMGKKEISESGRKFLDKIEKANNGDSG
ncbi:MAG: hypothetical protein DRP52_01670 [Planctomycetota bacterium]|nr:MAG: hypothetical protein DRP52_01670 [Planctomycetota bacterium]RLC83042.1 MAG: hypothetical protein DRJ03_18145 [Chloroflexota bacterium]